MGSHCDSDNFGRKKIIFEMPADNTKINWPTLIGFVFGTFDPDL